MNISLNSAACCSAFKQHGGVTLELFKIWVQKDWEFSVREQHFNNTPHHPPSPSRLSAVTRLCHRRGFFPVRHVCRQLRQMLLCTWGLSKWGFKWPLSGQEISLLKMKHKLRILHVVYYVYGIIDMYGKEKIYVWCLRQDWSTNKMIFTLSSIKYVLK